jgi:hypothetical protein
MKLLNIQLVVNDGYAEDNEYGINEQGYLVLADAIANVGGIVAVTPISTPSKKFQQIASA